MNDLQTLKGLQQYYSERRLVGSTKQNGAPTALHIARALSEKSQLPIRPMKTPSSNVNQPLKTIRE